MPSIGDWFGHPAPPSLKLLNTPSDLLALPGSMVGIEIECCVPHTISHNSIYWESVSDGSLRNGGYEHRYKQPVYGQDIIESLGEIEDFLGSYISDYPFDSNTSTHIHIDVRELQSFELASLLIYWVIFEKVIFKAFAPDRWDNNFCCPHEKAFDSINSTQDLYRRLSSGLNPHRYSRSGRYSAMNLESILQRGSIEFRLFNGEYRKEQLLLWINTLLSIKRASVETRENQWRPYINMKGRALEPFINRIFGEELGNSLVYKGIFEDVEKGINTARFIANHREIEEAGYMYDDALNGSLREDYVDNPYGPEITYDAVGWELLDETRRTFGATVFDVSAPEEES